jgi:hypothetical protein
MARCNGGYVTADGGAWLWREVEHRTGIRRRFAACFAKQRTPDRIEPTMEALVEQRVDAGFYREPRMAWCEAHAIASVFDLAKNGRLLAEVHGTLAQA